MLSFTGFPNLRNLIFVSAALIVAASLLYARYLARELAVKERAIIELKAQAIDIQGNYMPNFNNLSPFEQAAQDFISSIIISSSDDVPWIQTNEHYAYQMGQNLPFMDDSLSLKEEAALAESYINEYKKAHEPIKVELEIPGTSPVLTYYVLYGDSPLLRQLRWFPAAQLAVAAIFILAVLAAFAAAKRSEQNKVWAGLAKETAHQLGTPVSSLMAWVELLKESLKDKPEESEYLQEMTHDVIRLEAIADRFSKIGSEPSLESFPLQKMLDRSAAYLDTRLNRRGNIEIRIENHASPDTNIHISPQLFDWVIENLLKNAVDAIHGEKGHISLIASELGSGIVIDVEDSGRGISPKNVKKVFEPGFTTKKRGWGLGLSLTRRIVEHYHKGKIFVKSSELGKGTVFRIVLPKKV
ncbi:MAG: HAMP domain-containing sensor histidine kinase [Bacteroidia bacterium]